MVLIKSSFASVLVGAALTASASGAALPPSRDKHDSAPGLLDVKIHARGMQEVMMAPGQMRQTPKADAGRLAPAGEDVKHIAESLHPHPKFPKRAYKGDNVDFTQEPDKRQWRGQMGRRGPWRQDQQESLISLDLDGVKGDSPNHGTLLDLDARGQTPKGKAQDNGKDKAKAKPKPKKEEDLVSVDIDGVKGNSKAHGQLVDLDARAAPSKSMPKATPSEKPKEKSKEKSKQQGQKKQQNLVNADVDGVKGNSKGEGQVADVDARSFPPKPKSKGVPSSPDKPKEVPQPQPEPKGVPQEKAKEPAQKVDQGAQKEQDLISADVDGVKGDSRAKGQLVDVDARSFPPKPKAKPVGSDQTKELPKEKSKPIDQPPKQPMESAPKTGEAQKKEQDLVSADVVGVKGDSKAHGQLVDLDARGRPKAQPKKQEDLISIDLDGRKGNGRAHGSLLDLDARSFHKVDKDTKPVKSEINKAERKDKPEAHLSVHDKRFYGQDRVVLMDEEDRYTRPFPYRVFGGRPHRFVSQAEIPMNGDVHLHEHLHQHFAKRRHGDDVVVVDTHRHGHRHGHHHGHHRGDVVVVDKRRHRDDVVIVDGDRHGHYHGHVHTHGHHHGDVVIVDKRADTEEDGQHVEAKEGDASGFMNGEGRPGVQSASMDEPEEAQADVDGDSADADAGSEHAEGDLSKRRHGRHGHGHGGVTIVDRDLEERRHGHTKVVVVDGHRHHRHRPLIEVDKRQENAASVFNRIKSFLSARRHRETTVISTDRHGHGTTVVKTGRHGDTVIVDGHKHHRRHSTKINVVGDDSDYADTVIYEEGHRHHRHGRPIYIESGHSRDGVKIIPRSEPEDEEENLAPLYKRHHSHHGHGHHRHCRHGRCDDDDVVVVHTKRDVEMQGAPGYIDVTSPMFNSTTAQRIASLVLSTSNGTDAGSDFVLNASNNIRTQVYLVPINETTSASTAMSGSESGSPISVNLKVPIFVPASAKVEPYCATFDPAPTAPAPMSVMPCTAENNAHQSQTFLYYADTGVIHPDWKPAPASESLLNAMADTVEDDDDTADSDPQMSIDEIMPFSATGMPSETGSASIRSTSSGSMTAPSAGAMGGTESSAMPSMTSSIPELPSMTPSASATGSSMGAAAAAEPTMSAAMSSSASSSAAGPGPSGGSTSPSNVTLIFTPANPSAQSDMGSTSPGASSFESSAPTQENFGAQAMSSDAPMQSGTPSASASSSAAWPEATTPASASASTGPNGEAQGYPVTPTQSSYDPANPSSSSATSASTESYNGPDVSDDDDSSSSDEPETQGEAFTSTATGQDYTAPYQRR